MENNDLLSFFTSANPTVITLYIFFVMFVILLSFFTYSVRSAIKMNKDLITALYSLTSEINNYMLVNTERDTNFHDLLEIMRNDILRLSDIISNLKIQIIEVQNCVNNQNDNAE